MMIKINPKHFQKGVAFARKARGIYQPATQTWNIPDGCAMLNAPAAYGWIMVRTASAGQICPRCQTVCDGDCRA